MTKQSKSLARKSTPRKKRTAKTSNSKASPKKASSDKATKKGLDYRGEHFEGYNKPKLTPDHPTKKAAVLAKDGDTVKMIRFGAQGYGHNYSEESRNSYLARSKKLKGADSKLSANYWARKFLWAGKGGATQRPGKSASR
jgi:hypothetical protein